MDNRAFKAKSLKYDKNTCVYCGMPGDNRDHVLPKNFTGAAQRRFTPTVPSCQECNNLLGATVHESIEARRIYVHQKLYRKYKNVLSAPEWSEEEINSLGYTLRSSVRAQASLKQAVFMRLSWPDDPLFDAELAKARYRASQEATEATYSQPLHQ